MSAGEPISPDTTDSSFITDSSLITGATSPARPVREMGGYTLLREVGRGAMGEVWLGHDPRLDRKVAIKTMRCEIAEDPEYIKRFHREARAVAKLSHPHIVQIYGAGEEEGMVFFVMEWVNGRTLGAVIREHGQIPPKIALRIMKESTDALGYAAEQGVIHRDIKPGNIMVDAAGRVKVADFGLAKVADGQTCMTQTGVCLGSPNYMSPEACRGEELDHRSDQYSLGVTFFEMLKGELPYSAPTPMSVMFKHVHDPLPEPAALRTLDNGIWMDVLRRMTAKDAAHRFQTYDELREALSQVESASSGSLNSITPIGSTPTAMYTGAPGGVTPFSATSVLSTGFQPGSATPPGTPSPFAGSSLLSSGMPEYRPASAAYAPTRDWKRPALFAAAGLAAVLVLGGGIYVLVDTFGGSNTPPYVPQSMPTGSSNATVATPVATATPFLQVQAASQLRPDPVERGGQSSGRIPRPPDTRAPALPLIFKTLSPELVQAHENRDFPKMAELVGKFLAQPNLDKDASDLLRHIYTSVDLLKTFRAEIYTGASQRPSRELIKDLRLGQVWVTRALPDGTGLEYRTQSNELKPVTWKEISPVTYVLLGREYSNQMRDKTDAMMQLYSGITKEDLGPPPEELQGGQGGPGGGMQGPQGGPAQAGAGGQRRPPPMQGGAVPATR